MKLDNSNNIAASGATRFSDAPRCLVHAGRKDFQAKIRGHRSEVAEVGMALLAIAGIKQAAVIAHPNRSGENRLQCAHPLRTLFESPTIAGIADATALRHAEVLGQDQMLNLLVEIESRGDEETLFPADSANGGRA